MDMSLSKLGDSEGQGSLACCRKESDMTEQLNNDNNHIYRLLKFFLLCLILLFILSDIYFVLDLY